MGYMKWLSVLDQEDVETMRRLCDEADNNKIESVAFNNKEYSVEYLRSVIQYLEDFKFNHDMNNHREPEDLIY
mgnify:CR=1 FL=1